MAIENLEQMFKRADPIDLDEGLVAYDRYHLVMQRIADRFACSLATATAVFVALSPNSSYHQNLRSAVSVLDGALKRHAGPDDITVATYGHCKKRAWLYATGRSDFLSEAKGPKIVSFYHNILDPKDSRWVTVDGHMSCIWQGKNLSMRDALVSRATYETIRAATLSLAFTHYMIPCQMQAVLWFTRKRISNVVYDPQMQLFADRSDVWNTFVDVNAIKPYGRKDEIPATLSGRGRDVAPSAGPATTAHDELQDGQLYLPYRPGE